jgi:4-diphosphocytidyl-2-C-methyl-D-erythritol kinase
MNALSEHAPAKINLYLHVTGRRDDGYHLLDSLVMFAAVGDQLEIAAPNPRGTGDFQLSLSGPFAEALQAASAHADNLVSRAADGVFAHAVSGFRCHLRLEKNLPLAGGIGGGSADAAAAIRLLCRENGLDPYAPEMIVLALSIGSDIPACLYSRPAVMRGIGERLLATPVLPSLPVVLVNPGVAQPTPAVFRARHGEFVQAVDLPPEGFAHTAAMAAWLAEHTDNGLTEAAASLSSVVTKVLSALSDQPECLLARMSGSGNTCFGIFPSAAEAEQAAAALSASEPGWWVVPTTLNGSPA